MESGEVDNTNVDLECKVDESVISERCNIFSGLWVINIPTQWNCKLNRTTFSTYRFERYCLGHGGNFVNIGQKKSCCNTTF